MNNRYQMKNQEVKYDKKVDIPVPFWVKIKKQDYCIMFICFKDFKWEGTDLIIVDGVNVEFPYEIEYVQQDSSRIPDEDTRRWYSKQEYMDEYILSKA